MRILLTANEIDELSFVALPTFSSFALLYLDVSPRVGTPLSLEIVSILGET